MLQQGSQASSARSSEFATPPGARSASPGVKAEKAEGAKGEAKGVDSGRTRTRSPKLGMAAPVEAASTAAETEPPVHGESQRFRLHVEEPVHRPNAFYVRELAIRAAPEKYRLQGRWKYRFKVESISCFVSRRC